MLQKVQSGEFTDCDNRPENPSTGDVQVLLSWDNYNDLDLACIDPEGNTLWFKNKRVPSGGLLEIDMNVAPNDSKTPIENISWKPLLQLAQYHIVCGQQHQRIKLYQLFHNSNGASLFVG